MAAVRPLRDLSWIKIPRIPLWTVYIAGALPAVWLFYLALNNRLGADPAKTLERELGEWSLLLIIAGLMVTPLRKLFALNFMRYRRQIGLLAFFYAVLHVTVYVVLDQALDARAIINDIFRRPYITMGMISFTVLVALGVTSNNQSIKRLGAVTWNKLHRWVYLAAVLAGLHYVMLVKVWAVEPLLYLSVILALLLYRWTVRQSPA
jgi:methionine sulfoxide reductase heme-binding subunit